MEYHGGMEININTQSKKSSKQHQINKNKQKHKIVIKARLCIHAEELKIPPKQINGDRETNDCKYQNRVALT